MEILRGLPWMRNYRLLKKSSIHNLGVAVLGKQNQMGMTTSISKRMLDAGRSSYFAPINESTFVPPENLVLDCLEFQDHCSNKKFGLSYQQKQSLEGFHGNKTCFQ